MKILIIDGQGGKVGSLIVKKIKEEAPDLDLYVVGTNSIATTAMLKAGGSFGATGENPVVYNAQNADLIVGPMGIISANSILGEVTPKMAAAIGASGAHKILIPISNCNITVAGINNMQLADYIQLAAREACRYIGELK